MSYSRVPTAYWLALQERGAHPRMAAPLTVCEGWFNVMLATGFESAQPHNLCAGAARMIYEVEVGDDVLTIELSEGARYIQIPCDCALTQ